MYMNSFILHENIFGEYILNLFTLKENANNSNFVNWKKQDIFPWSSSVPFVLLYIPIQVWALGFTSFMLS